MNFNRVLKALKSLKLAAGDIIYCFVSGSRVWGTATLTSDYDFIVVTKIGPKQSVHFQNIDVIVINANEFNNLLKTGDFRALACQWLDPKFILKSKSTGKSATCVAPKVLDAEYAYRLGRDLAHAKKYYQKESQHKAAKVLSYLARHYMFNEQIKSEGKIVDYQCANEIYDALVKNQQNWDQMVELLLKCLPDMMVGQGSV